MHAYGMVAPKGVSKFRQTVLSQEMFGKRVDEFAVLEKQLVYDQAKLAALATTHPAWQDYLTPS
jgi:hypothetical protein